MAYVAIADERFAAKAVGNCEARHFFRTRTSVAACYSTTLLRAGMNRLKLPKLIQGAERQRHEIVAAAVSGIIEDV